MATFKDKVVLVTGSSSGIGAEIAIQFAEKGGKVVITGRNEAGLKNTLQKCVAAGATEDDILTIVGDITSQETRDQLVDETTTKFGKLDILVNNVGVVNLFSLENVTEEEIDWTFKTNVTSAVLLTQRAMSHLIKTKGNVVNISSLYGGHPFPAVLPYCMSKAAFDMFTKCAALDYADKGVRVNAVSPGEIPTPMMAKAGLCEDNAEAIRQCVEQLFGRFYPNRRTGEMSEVASVTLFLASDQASFVNGTLIPIDGGRSCYLEGALVRV